MYLNDYPKCITKNESNIPVFKGSGKKKSQGRSQFPELQKYIETIIKASNGRDSEDASDSGEKTAKEGKSGNNTMQIENKKVNKRKLNLNLNSERVNERTKTTVSVSSRENISNQFFSDFEDPRHWDIVTTQNDFHKSIKIEKVLKNLFPNPYKLLQIPEFKKPKISMYIEKIENDDVTLSDVIISEFDSQKTTDSTRVENIFEADRDKKSSQMELWPLNSKDKIRRYDGGRNNDKAMASFHDGLILNGHYSKNLGSDRSNNSASRQSSLENVKDSDSNRAEKKDFGRRRPTKSRKNAGENSLDYDIGKLKLLTLTDSDDSSKDPSKEPGKKLKEDFKNRINASESPHTDKIDFSSSGVKESKIVKERLNELSHKHKVNQTEARNRSKSDGRERKIAVKGKPKRKKSINNLTDTDDCPKIIEDDFGNYEEPKLKPNNVEVKEKKSNTSEEKDLKDETMERTNEKIDEVLRFMCDCLMKFRYEGDTVNESLAEDTDEIENAKSKWPQLDKPPNRSPANSKENLPKIRDQEISQVVLHIPSSKRLKAATYCRQEKKFQLLRLNQTEVRTTDVPDTVYPDSAAINNENVVQTVEIQNELGGYSEEQQQQQEEQEQEQEQQPQAQGSAKGVRLAKSVIPMSVRIKQRKLDTQKELKNALEREERLLSGGFITSAVSKKDFIGSSFGVQPKKSHSSCAVVGAFKRQHSNFVICVNSLPRNLRIGRLAGFSLAPWTISLDEIPRTTIKQLPFYQTVYLEEIKPIGEQFVRQRACRSETMLVFYRSAAVYITAPIGVLFVIGSSKVNEEILSKSSEKITQKYKPTKKSFYVEPSTPPKTIACVIEMYQKVNLDITSNLNDQVGELEDAMERTEVYFLEQDCNATYTASTSEISTESRNEMLRNMDWNEELEKRKLHDLLMRTYNLQQKIHRHLKMLTDKTISASCPSMQETSLDFGLAYKNSETAFRTPEDPTGHWYLQTPPKPNVIDEAVLVKVPKTDRGTSYDPPTGDENDSGDDDGSSTYSFKSSNDFSENEKELRRVPSHEENSKSIRFLENIFNEIDIFKNRLMLEQNKEKENEIKDRIEKRLAEPSEGIKNPTKLLKTVFKGKKSLTELSLGLKAVPLAKVSNISVEKRKISENHTKISICISKEKANEYSQDPSSSKGMMRNRLSYYLDSIRPSLSSCRTDYSRLENEVRRGESEDEEDDFKSVLSTLSRPHSEMNLAKEVPEIKKLEMTPPKTFTKHRFDFYQKMDASRKVRQKSLSNTSCTYKEFEPLKQALTEMQIRMRSLKRDAYFNSNDYYQRALKLAKMSAGYCQSCGSRSVIPQDTFGYYKTILPRNQSQIHRSCYLRATQPRSSYYSLESSVAELSDQFGDLDMQKSSSYLMNSSRTIIRNSLNDIPVYSGTV